MKITNELLRFLIFLSIKMKILTRSNCIALVVWETNLCSTVGYRMSPVERAIITALPAVILGVIVGIVLSDITYSRVIFK